MKKSALLLAFSVAASFGNMKAQTSWDFSSSAWPVIAGETSSVVKNNLGLVPGPATVVNFAQVEANNATFSDGYSGTKRFKLNGGGYTSTGTNTTPTQRYIVLRSTVILKSTFGIKTAVAEIVLYTSEPELLFCPQKLTPTPQML